MGSARPVILLPPSEGKATGGGLPGWSPDAGRFGAQLHGARRAVAHALLAADGGDTKLLGAKGELLEHARRANRSIRDAPTLPAWQRFTGVVWDHLDYATLGTGAKRRSRHTVLVISALTGVSALWDPVPDHRLKMSARLDPMGVLARWWNPLVSEVLDASLRRRVVVDLLANEHRAAWSPDTSRMDVRRVRFVDGSGRTIGHDSKAAKGLFARELLEHDDPESMLSGRWTHGKLRAEVTTTNA